MTDRARHAVGILILLATLFFTAGAVCQEPAIANWPAPPYLSPPASEALEAQGTRQALAVLSTPLPFVAIDPCRVVRTE